MIMKRYTPSELLWKIFRRLQNLVSPPQRFLKQCRRIIHVGANDGAERGTYAEHDLTVLWVEALPAVFAKLQENLRAFRDQSAVNALLSDEAGRRYQFNVSSHGGQSSSIYDFGEHKALWPEIEILETVELESTTLARLLEDNQRSIEEFDALILDVQGAELLVLKGAGELLANIRFVQAEAADFDAYSGGCTLEVLSRFLAERGFRIRRKDCFAWKKGVGAYYNVVFERRASASPGS